MKDIFLITGSAGFIGFHISKLLLEKGFKVIGIDLITDYYDIKLKKDRLKILRKFENFIEERIDIVQQNSLFEVLKNTVVL